MNFWLYLAFVFLGGLVFWSVEGFAFGRGARGAGGCRGDGEGCFSGFVMYPGSTGPRGAGRSAGSPMEEGYS